MAANDPQKVMREFEPTCEYFVGIDSDGCAFDTMEPKQKEVFCPTTIWQSSISPSLTGQAAMAE